MQGVGKHGKTKTYVSKELLVQVKSFFLSTNVMEKKKYHKFHRPEHGSPALEMTL